jgi:hypothetical protein
LSIFDPRPELAASASLVFFAVTFRSTAFVVPAMVKRAHAQNSRCFDIVAMKEMARQDNKQVAAEGRRIERDVKSVASAIALFTVLLSC